MGSRTQVHPGPLAVHVIPQPYTEGRSLATDSGMNRLLATYTAGSSTLLFMLDLRLSDLDVIAAQDERVRASRHALVQATQNVVRTGKIDLVELAALVACESRESRILAEMLNAQPIQDGIGYTEQHGQEETSEGRAPH
jgi:hypothetical protein